MLGERTGDDFSLTVGMNTGPFISIKEASQDPPLPAGTKAHMLGGRNY